MDLIVKGGTLVTANEKFIADISIENGKIRAIGNLAADNGTEIIDATDKLVMPGFIDAHVHLSLPFSGTISADTFETGTRAAAAGGVTTVIDFAIQSKGTTLKETIEKRKAEADGEVIVDYSLHGGITDWNENTKAELPDIIKKEGVSSFKMFMIYKSEGWLTTDPVLIEALEETKKLGGMIQVHAESVDLLDSLIAKHHNKEEMEKYGVWLHVVTRPNIIEAEAIQRAITWAEYTGGHLFIVHMSTGEGAAMVKAARDRGVNVIAETCPQYLILNEEVFKGENGHLFATCPQIKSEKDGQRLWQGLADGSISTIGTDTCTFNTEQKAMWQGDFTKIPFGLPGTELMVPLLYSDGVKAGKISLRKMVEVGSTNPAKVYGLYPQKGSLRAGSDADIVIFDSDKEVIVDYKNMETNCDWNPFQGKRLKGYPHLTLVRGKVVGKEGKCIGEKGHGKFVKRGTSGNYV
ncbi:MAG: dihydropyrimidinase [Candidatus Hodarchaeales archaeon]|jgi:dihydropyrimidinase